MIGQDVTPPAALSRPEPLSVSFHRTELSRILEVYSRRVVSGEWRDYAIDSEPGRAVFSIFRNSLEGPLFTITKRGDEDWEISAGPRSLVQADSLDKVLMVFSRELRLIP